MFNKLIYETGIGGDMKADPNGITYTRSLYAIVYLKLFGGNTASSTVRDNVQGELRYDWWGNSTSENPSVWINSETEKVLTGLTLVNSNIKILEAAIKKDLRDVSKYGDIEISIVFLGQNKIGITITITENENTTDVSIVWDATRNEAIIKGII